MTIDYDRLWQHVTAEAILTSLVGTTLSKEACRFSLKESPGVVFRKISSLKKELERGFERIAREEPAPPIGELIRRLRRHSDRKG